MAVRTVTTENWRISWFIDTEGVGTEEDHGNNAKN